MDMPPVASTIKARGVEVVKSAPARRRPALLALEGQAGRPWTRALEVPEPFPVDRPTRRDGSTRPSASTPRWIEMARFGHRMEKNTRGGRRQP